MSKLIAASPVTTTGEIVGVQNYGTIVVVCLSTEDDSIVSAYFDHRCFGWLLQGEQCTPEQLIGRTASFDGEAIELLD